MGTVPEKIALIQLLPVYLVKVYPNATAATFSYSGCGVIGDNCQISLLDSRMVRSVENLPLFAVLGMLMRVQRSWSR